MEVRNNDLRKLINSKANKISFSRGMPIPTEGRNGDFTVRVIEGKGIKLFLKANNKWYSIPVFSDFTKRDDLKRVISKRPPKYDGEIGFDSNSKEFNLKQSDSNSIKYAGSTTKIERDVNDGNPTFQIGSSDTECFKISLTYGSGGKGVEQVTLDTLTASGDADMGKYNLKVDGARHTILEDAGMRLYGKTFTINDSVDTGDIFKIETTTHGATTMSTVDDDATAAHMTLDADGDITLDAASGNIYVKNNGGAYTPGSDYEIATKKYVDDTHKWNFNTGSRWYTRYNYWYYPSTVYGINSVNWSSNFADTNLETDWLDSANPCIVVPEDCKINSYHFYGNFTSSQTYEVALLTGTPSYGSAGNTSLSQIGATQSLVATGNIYNKLEQTGLNVSVSAGDIIIPALRRTTTSSSTYYYFEFAMNIVGTVS